MVEWIAAKVGDVVDCHGSGDPLVVVPLYLAEDRVGADKLAKGGIVRQLAEYYQLYLSWKGFEYAGSRIVEWVTIFLSHCEDFSESNAG